MNKYMKKACEEAERGVLAGDGGPFGAVVVNDRGEIIGSAHNEVVSANDPTAHAEILAIRRASAFIQSFDLSGCSIYTVGEPCPMCMGAIQWARIDRIIYCNTKDEASRIGFDDKRITEMICNPEESNISGIHAAESRCAEILKIWEDKKDRILY